MAQTGFQFNRDKDSRTKKSPELRQVTREASAEQKPKQAGESRKVSPALQSRRFLGLSISVIVLVFAVLIVLLYNQSKVIEVNFANAALQRQINTLTKENAQRREAISKNMDLETIQREAERLGLQMPLESQIIEVKGSQKDQIVINLRSANAEGVDPGETDMAEIFTNVEGFFKTIR